MSILNKVRIVVYRFHEKGLEVFLLDDHLKNNPIIWKMSQSDEIDIKKLGLPVEYIEMDQNEMADNQEVTTIAIEADWHDIPSIRGLLKNDVKIAKEVVKEAIPGVDQGAYVAIKEVMKKAMPDQYKVLKELKDTLLDRNLLRNI